MLILVFFLQKEYCVVNKIPFIFHMKKIVRNRSYSTLRDTRKMQSKLSRLGNSGLTTHFYNKLQGGGDKKKEGVPEI